MGAIVEVVLCVIGVLVIGVGGCVLLALSMSGPVVTKQKRGKQ